MPKPCPHHSRTMWSGPYGQAGCFSAPNMRGLLAFARALGAMSLAAVLLAIPMGCSSVSDRTAAPPTPDSAEAAEIAKDAFIFGLPLVTVDITRRRTITGPNVEMNKFIHDFSFPDADFRTFVRPNVDTFYSNAFLDLTPGPVEVFLPEMGSRFHMLQLMDAYTNVFGVPGTRTTGNGGGTFFITGPGWKGQAPAGVREVYHSPTNHVWILGRTHIYGAQDGQGSARPLMEQYGLTPTEGEHAADFDLGAITLEDDANSIVAQMPLNVFFDYLNHLMLIDPPAEADREILTRMAKIGIGPHAQSDPVRFGAGEEAAIKANVLATLGRSSLPMVNGWQTTMEGGVGNFGTNYALRANISLFGLGANLPEDAVYFTRARDENGDPLDGSDRKYVLRFESAQDLPPAKAFWSLTVYQNNFLYGNEIDRYAVGSVLSDLVENLDGSVEIYIQNENPGGGRENNWLPIPSGPFDMTMRVYLPGDALLENIWKVPQLESYEK